MAKVIPKKERARRLLRIIEDGPDMGGCHSAEDYKERYQIWARSWVIGDLKALIPQLQEPKPK